MLTCRLFFSSPTSRAVSTPPPTSSTPRLPDLKHHEHILFCTWIIIASVELLT
ncbi:hypothetical protein KC19_3G063200 [Ceratodon purpureus]|uniref:Uncharacterized protein n=1 Tax=Ceratodon purpureus TaxID=3225 RepID=A0A8T0II38_CERPU|nr:hypothetical protein KC19_3G063200 [Ceratodon purpureus]